ncbi:MAG: hypothetical protein ACYDEI_00025 [Erysipelotrichaceae bacterium]
MNKKEKIDFINGIINTVKSELLSNIDKYPEDYDGKELRIVISERFDLIIWGNQRSEKRRVHNDQITKGF